MREGARSLDREALPTFVLDVVRKLAGAGYQAYLVGGSVRDLLMGVRPSDFDVATNAPPGDVMRLFERCVPVGARFGAVLVVDPAEPGAGVHVTTYRSESAYLDGRRPSEVRFSESIDDDLSRRDFTMNAVAWNPFTGEVVDPFGGRSDIAGRLIRAVGDPHERMREDALRTLRAIRFAAQLGFDIDEETWRAIEVEAKGARRLSAERVRDELLKILAAPYCGQALWMMVELGLMYAVLPELRGADRLAQAKRGAATLLDHLIQTAANCPPDPELRLAGLLHDVGKLETRAVDAKGRVTFHGHPQAGAETARAVCRRLRLSKAAIERVASLVEMHMSLNAQLGEKALRRWVARYGAAWVRDLIELARADAAASGWERPAPHLDAIERAVEEIVRRDEAFSKRDLAVNGRDVMETLGIGPGPEVGRILDELYEFVLEHPERNTKNALIEKMKAL